MWRATVGYARAHKPAAEVNGKPTPAVSIRRSVHRDYVVCLECGWRGQMLKRHVATGHGLTVEQYRARDFELPDVEAPNREAGNGCQP